jgi:hypothetical protein
MTDSPHVHSDSEYSQKMIELCRCGICYDIVNPRCQTCIKGHIFCTDCCSQLKTSIMYHKKYKQCPVCKELIMENNEFNFIKSLYDNLNFKLPCQNALYGCQEILDINKYHAHQNDCIYSPVKCIKCENVYDTYNIEASIEHMIQQHNYKNVSIINNIQHITDIEPHTSFTFDLHVTNQTPNTNYFIVKYSKHEFLEIIVKTELSHISISFELVKIANFMESESRTYQLVFNKLGCYTHVKKIIISDNHDMCNHKNNLILISWHDINNIMLPRTEKSHVIIPVKFIPYSKYIFNSDFDITPNCSIPPIHTDLNDMDVDILH